MRLAGGSNVTKNWWRTRLHSFTNFNGDGVAGCGSRREERCGFFPHRSHMGVGERNDVGKMGVKKRKSPSIVLKIRKRIAR